MRQPYRSGSAAKTLVLRQLRGWREAFGISQKEVARRIGIYPGSVSRLENGETMLTIERLVDYAAAVGINPTELLTADPSAGQAMRKEYV